jgi:hypothetical protein
VVVVQPAGYQPLKTFHFHLGRGVIAWLFAVALPILAGVVVGPVQDATIGAVDCITHQIGLGAVVLLIAPVLVLGCYRRLAFGSIGRTGWAQLVISAALTFPCVYLGLSVWVDAQPSCFS